MRVVLVLDVESSRGEDIDEHNLMVELRSLLLDNFDHFEYEVTSVPEFYT